MLHLSWGCPKGLSPPALAMASPSSLGADTGSIAALKALHLSLAIHPALLRTIFEMILIPGPFPLGSITELSLGCPYTLAQVDTCPWRWH